jgi:thioredoxin 1
MSVEVRELRRDTFQELVAESPRPVVIDFWGPQCKPCLALEPIFHELADRFADEVEFLRVEAPKNRMLCVDLKVMSLPTFLFIKEGVEVSRLVGDSSSSELSHWVQDQCEQAKGGDAVSG